MSQLDEIYDNDRIEKDTFRSMRELSKYTKILAKENNLFVIIKQKLHQIKLLSSKSLFKISLLLDTLPEETVSFTFYTEEKNEEENNINNDNIIINNIKKKKDNKNKKPNKNAGIYVIDNINKQAVEEIYKKGKGSIIGYKPNLFKLVWEYLYFLNIIISVISFISFSSYSFISISKTDYYSSFSNIITVFSLCLSIFISNSGWKKIKSKKKVNFRMENILFFCFIHLNVFCGFFWVFVFSKKGIEMEFCVLLIIEITLGLIDIICAVLIWLNVKMVEFYKEYSKLNNEGIPLVEV